MKVLHLVGRSHRRGAELVAMELATELDALGHRNHLFAVGSGHRGDTIEGLPALVPTRRQKPAALLWAGIRFRRVLREVKPDVILAHGGSAAQVCALASRSGNPPMVWQLIMGLPPEVGRVRRAWWGMAARRADAVVSLSGRLEAEVRDLGFVGPAEVIPNARRSERFDAVDRRAARESLSGELGLPPGRSIVGLVGHLVDQKDPLLAVEAFAALVDGGVDAHLVVVGSGPLEGGVRRAVERHGLMDRVSLLGHVDGVEQVLGGIDLLWLTSRDEGIPGILVEAAMCGCPSVTFPVGDVADVVEHDVTGVILDSRDMRALVAETADLLADPVRIRTMGDEARNRSRRLAMEVVVHDYLRVLQDLLQSDDFSDTGGNARLES